MRFEEEKIRGNGDTVYSFRFGKDELRLIFDAVNRLNKDIPRGVIALNPTKNRANNIIQEFSKFI